MKMVEILGMYATKLLIEFNKFQKSKDLNILF